MNYRLMVPLVVGVSACLISRSIHVETLERPGGPADTIVVDGPVKAHLIDGSTVLFRNGARVSRDDVWGVVGIRWSLSLRDSSRVDRVPLDSVLGMESLYNEINAGRTILYSTLATVAAIGGAVAIACAIDPKCFGSCPTFYADSAGQPVLEAEGFSYSIAPLFEVRDVDRLRFPGGADTSGLVRLEVRNEAFETHYINHLELLEVRHGAGEFAVPDELNRPFVVGDLVQPLEITGRDGSRLDRQLATADGNAYRTPRTILAQARVEDANDWIDIAAAAPPGADSIALVFRQRNSLLNTILLYDIMLGDPGARSLDWVGSDLQQVGFAVELAQWYQRKMGMDVLILDRGQWRRVAHLKDTGPVAWKDVAMVIPVVSADTVRIRLVYPADNWRFDRIAVARRFRRLPRGVTVHPLATVLDALDRPDTTARQSMAGPDERYLTVASGQRFTAEFKVGGSDDSLRTFFLASQGYYTEWVRNGWLRAPRSSRTFTPSDGALLEAIQRWQVTQDTLEARFMATRVPVR